MVWEVWNKICYEIGGNLNSWEAGGQAGKFYLWGMGLDDDERKIKKALAYLRRGIPGGVAGCKSRLKKKLSMKEKHVEDDDIWDSEERMYNCNHPCVNGMGLLSLYGWSTHDGLNEFNFGHWVFRTG